MMRSKAVSHSGGYAEDTATSLLSFSYRRRIMPLVAKAPTDAYNAQRNDVSEEKQTCQDSRDHVEVKDVEEEHDELHRCKYQ